MPSDSLADLLAQVNGHKTSLHNNSSSRGENHSDGASGRRRRRSSQRRRSSNNTTTTSRSRSGGDRRRRRDSSHIDDDLDSRRRVVPSTHSSRDVPSNNNNSRSTTSRTSKNNNRTTSPYSSSRSSTTKRTTSPYSRYSNNSSNKSSIDPDGVYYENAKNIDPVTSCDPGYNGISHSGRSGSLKGLSKMGRDDQIVDNDVVDEHGDEEDDDDDFGFEKKQCIQKVERYTTEDTSVAAMKKKKKKDCLLTNYERYQDSLSVTRERNNRRRKQQQGRRTSSSSTGRRRSGSRSRHKEEDITKTEEDLIDLESRKEEEEEEVVMVDQPSIPITNPPKYEEDIDTIPSLPPNMTGKSISKTGSHTTVSSMTTTDSYVKKQRYMRELRRQQLEDHRRARLELKKQAEMNNLYNNNNYVDEEATCILEENEMYHGQSSYFPESFCEDVLLMPTTTETNEPLDEESGIWRDNVVINSSSEALVVESNHQEYDDNGYHDHDDVVGVQNDDNEYYGEDDVPPPMAERSSRRKRSPERSSSSSRRGSSHERSHYSGGSKSRRSSRSRSNDGHSSSSRHESRRRGGSQQEFSSRSHGSRRRSSYDNASRHSGSRRSSKYGNYEDGSTRVSSRRSSANYYNDVEDPLGYNQHHHHDDEEEQQCCMKHPSIVLQEQTHAHVYTCMINVQDEESGRWHTKKMVCEVCLDIEESCDVRYHRDRDDTRHRSRDIRRHHRSSKKLHRERGKRHLDSTKSSRTLATEYSSPEDDDGEEERSSSDSDSDDKSFSSESEVEKRRFIRRLAARAYHFPGNTWCEDWMQYISNTHLVFGLFYHHPLHPMARRERLIILLGSVAVGLLMSNLIYLWFAHNEYGADDTVLSLGPGGQLDVSKLMITLWTLGSAVHTLFDLTIWHIKACTLCRLYGRSNYVSDEVVKWGRTVGLTIVLVTMAFATYLALLRASEDYKTESAEDVDGSDRWFTTVTFGGGAKYFDFLVGYIIEFLLAVFVYNPLILTIVFTGVLGCNGRVPVLGGRPREVMREQKYAMKRQSMLSQSITLGSDEYWSDNQKLTTNF